MTFYPEPLRPSEGRPDDEYRVNPIEANKHGKEEQAVELPDASAPNRDAALLTLLHKVTRALLEEDENPIESPQEDALAVKIAAFQAVLKELMKLDQSESQTYCLAFSEAWHQLLKELHRSSQSRSGTLYDLETLNPLLISINDYPKGQDQKLGYYLSEFAGKSWFPLPFRDILKRLHFEHRTRPLESTLSNWVSLMNEILQS